MRSNPLADFLFQVGALLAAIVLVHAVYITLVRPQAEAILEAQRQAETPVDEANRALVVIVRDYEQEACFILALWAFAIMLQKALNALRERRLIYEPLLDLTPGTSILPEDVREYARPLEALPQREREALLPRSLLAALQRFGSTRNIQDASSAVRETCDLAADRLDAELSMVRYIVWAIPSIGFIGTVRGIGAALGQAHRAVEGDIVGVTEALGVAFNSTFVALVISIFIMFLMHQLQLLQERLVLDTQQHAEASLVPHLRST